MLNEKAAQTWITPVLKPDTQTAAEKVDQLLDLFVTELNQAGLVERSGSAKMTHYTCDLLV